MKSIILAAGTGSRLGRYTNDRAKCLLEVRGKSLLEYQIETLRKAGIHDIIVVAGFMAEQIQIPDIRKIVNTNYETTNMVGSLMEAIDYIEGDIIISYGDIVFEQRVLTSLLNTEGDIVITVDEAWHDYWNFRYKTLNFDLEGLKISNGVISQIGFATNSIENMQARYVGLNLLKGHGSKLLKEILTLGIGQKPSKFWNDQHSFANLYFTDILQKIIDLDKVPVFPNIIQHGWLEFDTVDDYEKTCCYLNENYFRSIFSWGS